MKTIEQNLRDICKHKGLTMTDVANRIGTSPSNLLSSVKANPKLSTIEDIANALQVSISELLTKRPEKAQGIAIIDGKTYQLSKPASSTVQITSYDRYDILRMEVKDFIKKSIKGSEPATKMGLVQTMELFSLVYDPEVAKFYLSLCYAEGKTYTCVYDKFEYCNWREEDTNDTVEWNVADITKAIINDVEGLVPQKLNDEYS